MEENKEDQNIEQTTNNESPLIEGEDFTYIPNLNSNSNDLSLNAQQPEILLQVELNEDNESDIEEDEEEDSDDTARIAFVEELEEDEKYLLLPEHFPSKIGGKLSWIGGPLLRSENERLCPVCNEIMPLLLQLYAPLDWVSKSAYHRLLFILCCKNPSCHSSRTNDNNDNNNNNTHKLPFKVYRTQLPQDNQYIEDEDQFDNGDDNSDELTDEELQLYEYLDGVCEVCGWEGKKKCGKCKGVHYCSRQHQVLDWKAGHDQQCPLIVKQNNDNNNVNVDRRIPEKPSRKIAKKRKIISSAKKAVPTRRFEHNFLFKEFFIESDVETKSATNLIQKLKEGMLDEDDEDEEFIKEREENNELMLVKLKSKLKEYHGEAFDEDAWKSNNSPNRYFLIFQQVIADQPNQILRYSFSGCPLWITDDEKQILNDEDIPPCPHCSSPRVFEFQVFPQLLYYLNVDEGLKKDSIDWGTLVVYTCSKSCEKENVDIYEEFLWRQMLESPFK